MISKRPTRCFFTGEKTMNCVQQGTSQIDGYCYAIPYKGMLRMIKLSDYVNTEEGKQYLKLIGEEFLDLIDKNDQWDFFDYGQNLGNIRAKFEEKGFLIKNT